MHFEDGSGLSRRTLVTPRAVVALLKHMNRRPEREWDALLPIGGEDGSLARRFDKSPKAAALHAKTGTLATVNALSGYITTRRGRRLIFSMIANNQIVPAAEIRKAADKIGLALIDWDGR